MHEISHVTCNSIMSISCESAMKFGHRQVYIPNLIYPKLARLRESVNKSVVSLLPTVTTPCCVGVPVKRGLVVTYCHHSMLCRRSREAWSRCYLLSPLHVVEAFP